MKHCKLLLIVITIAFLCYVYVEKIEKSINGGKTDILTEETNSVECIDQPAALRTKRLPETEETEQIGQAEAVLDESFYKDTVELKEIPELGYRNFSDDDNGNDYICYNDTLILGNIIYKKEAEKYVKQKLMLPTILGIDFDYSSVQCIQYENFIIAVSEDRISFLIYDMDTHLRYCCYKVEEDMMIAPFWYVYDGCIYYSEWVREGKMERTLKKMDLLSGDNVEILRPENGKRDDYRFRDFKIRDDGTIVYEIVEDYGNREYWIAEPDGYGGWNEKKIWETPNWKYAHLLDFNQYGLIILGESSITYPYEIFVIKDNGEAEELCNNLNNLNNVLVGGTLFTNDGYFCSNIAELENMPWSEDEWLSRYLADSVSFYDYEGNRLNTYSMINKELLEQGYYLKKLTYCEEKLTGFYVQRDTEELYISQVGIILY